MLRGVLVNIKIGLFERFSLIAELAVDTGARGLLDRLYIRDTDQVETDIAIAIGRHLNRAAAVIAEEVSRLESSRNRLLAVST